MKRNIITTCVSTCLAALILMLLSHTPAGAAERVRWSMQSTYAGSLVQLGTLGKRLETRIAAVSDGAFRIKFHEPGALVPALELSMR